MSEQRQLALVLLGLVGGLALARLVADVFYDPVAEAEQLLDEAEDA